MGASPITKEQQKQLIEGAKMKAENFIRQYEEKLHNTEMHIKSLKESIARKKKGGYDVSTEQRTLENEKDNIKRRKEDIKRIKENLKREIEEIKSRPIKK